MTTFIEMNTVTVSPPPYVPRNTEPTFKKADLDITATPPTTPVNPALIPQQERPGEIPGGPTPNGSPEPNAASNTRIEMPVQNLECCTNVRCCCNLKFLWLNFQVFVLAAFNFGCAFSALVGFFNLMW
uniref:Uncharacterized protein n=1 Tax=Panagrolaimus superbus TaxID=310955 RepID=A0A914YHP4_9BILA